VVDLAPFDLLLSVAETGSMGAAARRHGISQPAVSARLRTLEASVGFPLLERSPRGAHLTEAGALVAHWAQAAVDAAALLDEGLGAVRAEATSRLRVAASLTVAEYLLPRWLIELRTSLPDTTVALTSHNSTDTADDVHRGAADLGFVEGPTPPPDLDYRDIATDQLTVVVGRNHPWSRRRRIGPAQLAETALVTREQGSGTRTSLEQALQDAGHPTRERPALELSSTTAIKNAAAQGIAPAVLSSLAITGEIAAGALIAVPVPGLDLRRTLRAVWPTHQHLAGPARELLAIAARHRPTPRGRRK
jgi:DNA-binding transcriptional LysR family regulator